MNSQPMVLAQPMMLAFLWGACAFGAAAVAVFFARFYSLTRDRLFIFFSSSFGILAAHWLVLTLRSREHPATPLVYAVRLVAFLLFAVGVVDKNRR